MNKKTLLILRIAAYILAAVQIIKYCSGTFALPPDETGYGYLLACTGYMVGYNIYAIVALAICMIVLRNRNKVRGA